MGCDPFAAARCGGLQRMATLPAEPSIDATTAAESQSAPAPSSSAPVRQSFCEPHQLTLFSCGGGSSTTADKKASIAPSSAMKARTFRRSLSDRLTQSLITHGLVCGITPTSIRQLCGQPIRALAFGSPDGGGAD